MERTTYEIEARVERDHWWFRGRRRVLARLLAGLRPALPARARALDVGCGTGANGPVLAAASWLLVGLDASPIPLALARDAGGGRRGHDAGGSRRGHDARVRGDAAALPFGDATFDLVVALDVLEHLADDGRAAGELARVLAPGGAAIVFVPALRLLWGLQDEVSHHLRRYTAGELRRVLEGAGLRLERLTYFNALLFPPILAARLAMRLWRPARLASENQLGGRLANAVAGAVFAAEAPLVARLDLPIGVSLAAVARRG